jgi:hypothetical protein
MDLTDEQDRALGNLIATVDRLRRYREGSYKEAVYVAEADLTDDVRSSIAAAVSVGLADLPYVKYKAEEYNIFLKGPTSIS